MVTTQKKLKKQKQQVIEKKEENPSRLKMKYADAVVDNKRIKDEREKIAAFKEGLQNKEADREKENVTPPYGKVVELNENQLDRISKIEAKIEDCKGKPGAVKVREELNAQIEAIKAEKDEE